MTVLRSSSKSHSLDTWRERERERERFLKLLNIVHVNVHIHAHGKIGNRGRKELEETREGGRGEKRIKRTKRIETKYMEATMYSTCTCTYNNNYYY